MSDQAKESDRLPVPVKDYPYWRVVFRPKTYDPELIASVSDCVKPSKRPAFGFAGGTFPSGRRMQTSTRFAPRQLPPGPTSWEALSIGNCSRAASSFTLRVREATRANWRENFRSRRCTTWVTGVI